MRRAAIWPEKLGSEGHVGAGTVLGEREVSRGGSLLISWVSGFSGWSGSER